MTANPTHEARADQCHGEELPDAIEPGEGEVLRYGMEQSKTQRAATEYRAKKAASKAKDKARAVVWKEAFEAKKRVTRGMFNTNLYRCWMMGNGQTGGK